jgi:molybdopterin converting factor small subunit
MFVRVQLFAYLSKFSPTGQEKFQMELEPEATVEWLIAKLRIPSDFEKMILVNGRQANVSMPLEEGDDVFIFPPSAGG